VDHNAVKGTSRRLVIELVVVVLASFHAGLPKAPSYAQAWRAVPRYPLLVLHILVGLVIVLEAVIFLGRCLGHRHAGWAALAFAGLILVLVAFVSGDRYLATQRLSAIDLMGVAWFAALLTYSLGWYLARRPRTRDAVGTR
jgi:hypothetical protein